MRVLYQQPYLLAHFRSARRWDEGSASAHQQLIACNEAQPGQSPTHRRWA
jgi:hypothetical protein